MEYGHKHTDGSRSGGQPPIDWNAPLEAYHPDGRVVEVGLLRVDIEGEFIIQPRLDEFVNTFKSDGGHIYESKWKIRNRQAKPAISDELASIVENFRDGDIDAGEMAAMVCDLVPKPVDRDLELAREIAREYKADDSSPILAAIKRVRAEYE